MPTHKRKKQRDGAALVELALCLPLLSFLLLATIESCVMLQVQQNLALTAYEGARIGIMPGTKAGSVSLQCKLLLDDRSIEEYAIQMTPSNPESMSPGDLFTVTIVADCAANSVIGGVFYKDKTITESVVMRAE